MRWPERGQQRPKLFATDGMHRDPADAKVATAIGERMPIPHWLIGIAIFGGLAAFVGFAFDEGVKVKPDRNKDPDEWSRYGGTPPDNPTSSDGRHFG